MSEPTGYPEGASAGAGASTGAQTVVDAVSQLVATASVEAAFGESRTVGDHTVIPVAEVMCGFGVGIGRGGGKGPAESTSTGEGGAGGGGARSRPIAAVVMSPGGVVVEPIFDFTRISLAGIATVGFALIWLLRLLGGARAVESPAAEKAALRTLRRLGRE